MNGVDDSAHEPRALNAFVGVDQSVPAEPKVGGIPKRVLPRIVRIAVIFATVAVLFVTVRKLNLSALGTAFRQARGAPLCLAALLSLANLWCKAVMWRVMLGADRPPSLGRLFRYTVAAFAASAFTPGRAGELLRMWLLRRHDGVPYSRLAGAALSEKLLDGFGLLIFVAPLLWLPSPLQSWARSTVLIVAAVGVGGFVFAALAANRFLRDGRVASFLRNIRILRDPRVLAGAMSAAIAASMLDFAMLWLSLGACGLGRNFADTAFVLLVMNVALVVPTTPGNLGALEAAGIVALGLLGVGRPQALAFVLLYHAVQLGPLFVFTLFNLRMVFGSSPRPQTSAS
jgi:hypothetical protein